MIDGIPSVHVRTNNDWRRWLRAHHARESSVWLISHKKHTGQPSISHRESIHEAICFGWIDTTLRRLDHDTYARRFVKRNRHSRWSTSTQRYARAMISGKRMTPAGLRAYKEGLQKPVIDHGLPRNPKTPRDLQLALKNDKQAHSFFLTLAPSYRRSYIYWIERAKREETRQRRLKQVVQRLKQQKKPGL